MTKISPADKGIEAARRDANFARKSRHMRSTFNHRISPRHGLKLADVPALVAHIASLPVGPLKASRLLIIGIDNAFDVPTEPSVEPYESGALSCAIGTVDSILDDGEYGDNDCPMCGDAPGSYAYCLEHGELG